MRYLGLDLGAKTLGIAISDRSGLIAKSYDLIRFEKDDYQVLVPQLKNIIEKEGIEKIILGYPKNMNNTIGLRAEISQNFKKLLEESLEIEVELFDERLTTIEAESVLIDANVSRAKRKNVVDKLAAVIILQNYLNGRRN